MSACGRGLGQSSIAAAGAVVRDILRLVLGYTEFSDETVLQLLLPLLLQAPDHVVERIFRGKIAL